MGRDRSDAWKPSLLICSLDAKEIDALGVGTTVLLSHHIKKCGLFDYYWE
jgi:hypothetical protein